MPAAEKRKIEIYYLGRGNTQPAFSRDNKLTDFALEIKDLDIDYASNVSIGTFINSETITLNQLGASLNNLIDFNSRMVMGCSLREGFPHAAAVNSLVRRFCSFAVEFQNLLATTPYTDWYALVSNNYYLVTSVAVTHSSTQATSNIFTQSLYNISDNVRIGWAGNGINSTNYTDATYVSDSYGLRVYTSLNATSIFKKNGEFAIFQTDATYQLSGSTTPSTNRVRYSYSAANNYLQQFLNDLPLYEADDPYQDAPQSSEEEGGTGNFDNSTTPIDAPSVPTTSVTGTGFVRIYNPTLSQLQDLARYLWTDTTFIDTIANLAKKMLENPMDAIISLNLLPCYIPNHASEEVKVMFVPTGVNMPPVVSQFVEVDCGYYELEEYYGSALDYSPYTKISCYLPYIGEVPLNTDEVMGHRISIKYRVDIVTGMCVALISVDNSVRYQHSGHCAISMPLTSGDFSSYISAAVGVAKSVAGLAAAAAGAPTVASGLLDLPMPSNNSTYTKTTTTTRNEKTGRQVTTGTNVRETVSPRSPSYGEMAKASISNSVSSVMGAKTSIERTGGFSGNSGYLAVKRPFLTIEVPRMCLPENYGKFRGYPSMINVVLGNCVGYTEVQEIHLSGLKATNPELSEIVTLLKGGVIF